MESALQQRTAHTLPPTKAGDASPKIIEKSALFCCNMQLTTIFISLVRSYLNIIVGYHAAGGANGTTMVVMFCLFDELSRGSVLCLLNASFEKRFHNATTRFFQSSIFVYVLHNHS
jgi:hypothetical protein